MLDGTLISATRHARQRQQAHRAELRAGRGNLTARSRRCAARRGRCACWPTISSVIPKRSFAAKPGRQNDDKLDSAFALDRIRRGCRRRLRVAPPSRSIRSTPRRTAGRRARGALWRHRSGRSPIPAAVDQPQFVVQVAPNRVEVDEFNRWAAPLERQHRTRRCRRPGRAARHAARVAVAPFANFNPAYRVTINVQRFESVPGESALIEAMWTVRKRGGRRHPLGPHGRPRNRAGQGLRVPRRRAQPRAREGERRHRRRHPRLGAMNPVVHDAFSTRIRRRRARKFSELTVAGTGRTALPVRRAILAALLPMALTVVVHGQAMHWVGRYYQRYAGKGAGAPARRPADSCRS